MHQSHQPGFTIIELMVTLAIIAVLLTIVAPSLRDLRMNAAMTGAANDLITDLALARSESVKRGMRTAICTSTSGAACTNSLWGQGWIIYLDSDADGDLAATTDIVKVAPAVSSGITISSVGHSTNTASARYIPFRPSGATNPAGPDISFTLCDSRTVTAVGANAAAQKARTVSVLRTGRANVSRISCP
jgi:type IV fimbrial biogenesis protein FimT